jgi:hypothetical protein
VQISNSLPNESLHLTRPPDSIFAGHRACRSLAPTELIVLRHGAFAVQASQLNVPFGSAIILADGQTVTADRQFERSSPKSSGYSAWFMAPLICQGDCSSARINSFGCPAWVAVDFASVNALSFD